MSSYGYIIRWRAANYGPFPQQITVVDCASLTEAKTIASRLARNAGWTPPRWWKFWRRGDIAVACRNHSL